MAENSELEYEDEQAAEETAERPPVTPDDGSSLPVKEGAIFGAGAFLLSYVASLMVVLGTLSTGGATDGMAATWEAAGLALLGGLGAEVQQEGNAADIATATGAGDAGLFLAFSIPLVVLTAAIVVTAAGYGVAKYTEADGVGESVKASVLVVPGWLVLALVTSFVAAGETEAQISYGLATADVFLYAGIVFPAVFAIVGGLLASWPDPVDEIMAKVDEQT